MKYSLAFLIALAAFGILFLGLDVALFNAQGLSFIFKP